MKAPLLFPALGLGVVLFACSGSSGDGLGQNDDDLTRAKAACENKACGESCSLCPPDAKDCFETAVLKQCNANGRCSSEPAECALDAGPAPELDGGPVDIDGGPAPDGGAYEPCGGKTCGDTCRVCEPADPDCLETAAIKFCHAGGECLPTPPACIPPPPYQPCAGKACGDPCTICDPADPNCFETAVLKQCDKTGACVATAVVCGK